MHLYIREKETGRFVTHFIVPDNEWLKIEMAAKIKKITVEEFILEAIKWSLSQHSSSEPLPSE